MSLLYIFLSAPDLAIYQKQLLSAQLVANNLPHDVLFSPNDRIVMLDFRVTTDKTQPKKKGIVCWTREPLISILFLRRSPCEPAGWMIYTCKTENDIAINRECARRYIRPRSRARFYINKYIPRQLYMCMRRTLHISSCVNRNVIKIFLFSRSLLSKEYIFFVAIFFRCDQTFVYNTKIHVCKKTIYQKVKRKLEHKLNQEFKIVELN